VTVWDQTARQLRTAVDFAHQQAPIKPGGNQISPISWPVVFDEEHFFKVIDDHEKTIEECKTLLRKTESYLSKSGTFQQLRFNVKEVDKFKNLTTRVTSQTSRLITLLKPLQLSLDIDTNRKVHRIYEFVVKEEDRRRETLASENSVNQLNQIDELGNLNNQREAQIYNQESKCTDTAELRPENEKNGQGEADQILELLWNPDGTIQLEITTFEQRDGEAERVVHRTMELNAKTTRLIPLYAQSNKDANLSVRIYDGSISADLHFSKLVDLLQFQQAVTEYEVYDAYSQGPVDVTLRFSSDKTPTQRKAFFQFWIPKRLEQGEKDMVLVGTSISDTYPRKDSAAWSRQASRVSISSSSGSTSISSKLGKDIVDFDYGTVESPTSPFPTSPLYSPSMTRINYEKSQCSPSTNAALTEHTNVSEWPTGIASPGSSRASKITLSGSPLGAGIRRQSMNGAGSTQAQAKAHGELRRPMLVLLMYDSSSRWGDGLSIITVEVDDKTKLVPSKCGCRGGSECPHVTIERPTSKNHLLAQKYEMQTLEEWDITLPGTRKRNDYPTEELEKLSTLQSVSITLAEPGDPTGPKRKKKFAGYKCGCKYKTFGDMQKCLQARHQGNFGIVQRFAEKLARDVGKERQAQQGIRVGTRTVQIGGRR
jgi:hypothetical protein